mmetsp:Transcript_33631/g.34259  ORF Transcript_33631/g.34259 Transcript_33631/m.34259 type:complete len:95 (-) Transcript_33631:214-498(-)|eukprot:CAMPEP_0182425026 /NCGR_PEP_ID=MMETSP1167-20130531/11360_1 /TAXON_ID=2988 /ORGANISM="Mallomonas Sp, Strain CCMP3275" /LENGTH=94 /DNA_ID=CAMNT_0024605337 /DNA_START=67 /DNA_END=351 /DNA_ORIENTATION=-
MSRVQVIVVIALALLACAAAFQSPARFGTRSVSKMTQVQMAPVEAAVEATNVLSQFSQLLASEGDFGGYAGPAGSLIFIGFIILTLSPPLAPKE